MDFIFIKKKLRKRKHVFMRRLRAFSLNSRSGRCIHISLYSLQLSETINSREMAWKLRHCVMRCYQQRPIELLPFSNEVQSCNHSIRTSFGTWRLWNAFKTLCARCESFRRSTASDMPRLFSGHLTGKIVMSWFVNSIRSRDLFINRFTVIVTRSFFSLFMIMLCPLRWMPIKDRHLMRCIQSDDDFVIYRRFRNFGYWSFH